MVVFLCTGTGITWCCVVAEKIVSPSEKIANAGMRVVPNEDHVINRYLLCGDRFTFGQVTSTVL